MVRKVGPQVAEDVLASIGFSVDAKHVLTKSDARGMFRRVCGLDNGQKEANRAFLVTELDGWTFFESSDVIIDVDVSKIAQVINADVCWACAVSTTWALNAEYARPDGRKRIKAFYLDIDFMALGPGAFDTRRVKDERGQVLGFDIMPKALIGPDHELVDPEGIGKEETSGDALMGELPGLIVSDDERLIRYLVSIGIPVGAMFNQWYCSVPDVVMDGHSKLDIVKACLEGIKRDDDVVRALGHNDGDVDKGCVYLSGPLSKAGKLGPGEHKRSLFSRLRG